MRLLLILSLLFALLHPQLATAKSPSQSIQFSFILNKAKDPNLKSVIPGTGFTYEQALRPLLPHFSIDKKDGFKFGENGPFPPPAGAQPDPNDSTYFNKESSAFSGESALIKLHGKPHLLWLIDDDNSEGINYAVLALVALDKPAPRLIDARSIAWADRWLSLEQILSVGNTSAIVISSGHTNAGQGYISFNVIGIESTGRLRQWYDGPALIRQKGFEFDPDAREFFPSIPNRHPILTLCSV